MFSSFCYRFEFVAMFPVHFGRVWPFLVRASAVGSVVGVYDVPCNVLIAIMCSFIGVVVRVGSGFLFPVLEFADRYWPQRSL